MTTAPLLASVQIRLSALGAGTAKVGPLSAREVWHPSNVSVSANQGSVVNEATCTILVGDSNNKTNRDATVNGSSGDATDKVNADTIRCGEYVWAAWTGADASVIATLTVTGTKDI